MAFSDTLKKATANEHAKRAKLDQSGRLSWRAFVGGASMRTETERGATLQGITGRQLAWFELERITPDAWKEQRWYYLQKNRELIASGEKACCTCGRVFPATLRYWYSNQTRCTRFNPDGLASECKACHTRRVRKAQIIRHARF